MLRLGHRESIDYDFFSNQSFQPLQLSNVIPYLKGQVVIHQSENTLFCRVGTQEGSVIVSLFGGLTLKQIDRPEIALDWRRPLALYAAIDNIAQMGYIKRIERLR